MAWSTRLQAHLTDAEILDGLDSVPLFGELDGDRIRDQIKQEAVEELERIAWKVEE